MMATQLQTETGIVRVPTGTWRIDPTHSSIEFEVKHMMAVDHAENAIHYVVALLLLIIAGIVLYRTGAEYPRAQVELGVSAGVVLALALGLFVISRTPVEPREQSY